MQGNDLDTPTEIPFCAVPSAQKFHQKALTQPACSKAAGSSWQSHGQEARIGRSKMIGTEVGMRLTLKIRLLF